jgi:uncharacterized protein YrzB (UPF0473 family)
MEPEKNIVREDEEEEIVVVELTDEETGEVFCYEQEMIIPVNGENYALLVPYREDAGDDDAHEHEPGCECGCEDDAAFFAKIVTDENGEDSYEVPSDEEFNAVLEAYDALMDDEDEA